MCKTDGAAWRNSVMVDFSPGARSPRGTTARVVARGSFRDALSTRDCFTNTKTSKKSAAAAHPYIHMDWRVQRLASGLYIDYVSNTDSNSGYHSAVLRISTPTNPRNFISLPEPKHRRRNETDRHQGRSLNQKKGA